MEEPNNNFEILSTEGELRGFVDSSMYKDFVSELDVRIHELVMNLEDSELSHTGRFYDLLRGGIKNMRQMKDIFEDLLHERISQDTRESSKK